MDVSPAAAGSLPAQLPSNDPRSATDILGLTEVQQRRLVLDMVRAGHSDQEIGACFSLTQWQVRNLRYRLGIKRPRGRHGLPAGASGQDHAPAGPRRMPLVSGERLGVRMVGEFSGDEAGSRLTALGTLLAAAEGRFAIRVAVQQLGVRG